MAAELSQPIRSCSPAPSLESSPKSQRGDSGVKRTPKATRSTAPYAKSCLGTSLPSDESVAAQSGSSPTVSSSPISNSSSPSRHIEQFQRRAPLLRQCLSLFDQSNPTSEVVQPISPAFSAPALPMVSHYQRPIQTYTNNTADASSGANQVTNG